MKYIEAGIVLCSENKGADQLHGYQADNLCLCLCKCKKPLFSWRCSHTGRSILQFLCVTSATQNNAASQLTTLQPTELE